MHLKKLAALSFLTCLSLLFACRQRMESTDKNADSIGEPFPNQGVLLDGIPPLRLNKIDEAYTVDCGNLNTGVEYKVRIAFKNETDKPLRIKNIVSSCGCLVAYVPTNVTAAGDFGEIYALLKPRVSKGNFEKSLTVETPEGRVKFSLKANYQSSYIISPIELNLAVNNDFTVNVSPISENVPKTYAIKSMTGYLHFDNLALNESRLSATASIREDATRLLKPTIERIIVYDPSDGRSLTQLQVQINPPKKLSVRPQRIGFLNDNGGSSTATALILGEMKPIVSDDQILVQFYSSDRGSPYWSGTSKVVNQDSAAASLQIQIPAEIMRSALLDQLSMQLVVNGEFLDIEGFYLQ